jgi:hypothetical protein
MNNNLKMRLTRKRRGTALIELSLVMFPALTILFSVIVVGWQLGNHVRVSQVVRDTGSMYGRGIDFTQTSNQDIVALGLAQGLGLQRGGGTAVMILSQVTWVPQATCTANALAICNGDSHVIKHRIWFGNSAISHGRLGWPTGMDSTGAIPDYLTNTSALATFPFGQVDAGKIVYATEGFFQTPSFSFPGLTTAPSVYAVVFF